MKTSPCLFAARLRPTLRRLVVPTLAVLLTSFATGGEAPKAPKAPEPPIEPPALRSRAEIAAVLRQADAPPAHPRPLRVLLVAGPKDHGKAQHDYPLWLKTWPALLGKAENVVIDTAYPWPKPEQWDGVDVAVFYLHTKWDAAQVADIAKLQSRGGGVVTIHWAIGCDDQPENFAARVGLAYPAARYREGPIDLKLTGDSPILKGLPRTIRFTDEAYWPLVGDTSRIRILGTSDEQTGGAQPSPVPLFWTYEPGQGRAFVCIFGHFMWTFDDPYFRLLLLRGMAWAAHEPVNRFDALSIEGVKLAE